jgi:5-methylcytosine-specific restriction endonuclease McrA
MAYKRKSWYSSRPEKDFSTIIDDHLDKYSIISSGDRIGGLVALEKELAGLKSTIASTKRFLTSMEEEHYRLIHNNNINLKIRETLEKDDADNKAKLFFKKKLLNDYSRSKEVKEELDRLRGQISKGREKPMDKEIYDKWSIILQELLNYQVLLNSAIEAEIGRRSAIAERRKFAEMKRAENEKIREIKLKEKALRMAEAEAKRIEKEKRNAALAAAHQEKTRKLSKSVINKIAHQRRINPNCPYCGLSLKEGFIDYDHIYPIARGGLSSEDNMVAVCKTCNNRKSDQTLRDFAKYQGLNIRAIEERLDILGKKF